MSISNSVSLLAIVALLFCTPTNRFAEFYCQNVIVEDWLSYKDLEQAAKKLKKGIVGTLQVHSITSPSMHTEKPALRNAHQRTHAAG